MTMRANRRDALRAGMLYGSSLALTTSSSAVSAAVPTNSGEGLSDKTARAAGLEPKSLRKIETAMSQAVQDGEVPGLVTLLYRRGTVAHICAAGFQDLQDKSRTMKRDTIFRIASMSKPITAVATLILVEDGKIDLYDPVEKFIPELSNRKVLRTPASNLSDTVEAERPIRVIDLLTFRSGLVMGIDTANLLIPPLFVV